MSFMGSMLGSMAGRMMVPVMGVAGIGAYKSGALDGLPLPLAQQGGPGYYEMSARVTTVQQACRLQIRQDGKLKRTQAMDCSRAVEMLKIPSFAGYTVVQSEHVEYIYYAPDGESTLTGTLSSAKAADGRVLQRGAVIQIKVNAENPEVSQVI